MTTSQIGIPIIHGHGRWDLLTMSNRIHNLYRYPVGQPPQGICVGNTSTTKRGIRVRLKCMTRLPMCWWKPGHLPTKKPTNKKSMKLIIQKTVWLIFITIWLTSCSKDKENCDPDDEESPCYAGVGASDSECWYNITIDGVTTLPNTFGQDKMVLG